MKTFPREMSWYKLLPIYVNDITDGTQSKVILYANDLTFIQPLNSPNAFSSLHNDLDTRFN